MTGLDSGGLEDAPSLDAVLPQLQQLLPPESLVIGHSVHFDTAMITKYWSDAPRWAEIDTYHLAQQLVHYASSYSLEVLGSLEGVSQHFDFLASQIPRVSQSLDNHHDAFYDSVMSMALFRFCVERLLLLGDRYP